MGLEVDGFEGTWNWRSTGSKADGIEGSDCVILYGVLGV
jgi:hypothetical protein